MSFFVKYRWYQNDFKYFLQWGSDKISAVNIFKNITFNKDVHDSEWALTSRPVGLVWAW